MNILSTQYSIQHKAFEVYVAGCRQRCKGCHNPETWDFDQGYYFLESFFNKKIKLKIIQFYDLIEHIWVLGGEPLDQDLNELKKLLTLLKQFDKKVWLWTSREIDEIPVDIKGLCDYIKTGRYIERLRSEDYIQHGVKLASTNQKIWQNVKGEYCE